MYKLSIIVAVYNCENYIEKCLESLIKNIDFSYEVLLVDDGSSDNSFNIIKKYESDIVKVYTKKNKGLCDTRNFGIEKSSGEFITFIDGDDFVDDNYLYFIKENLDNDLVVFNYQTNFTNENYILKNGCLNVNGNKNYILDKLFDYNLFNFAWNKIYKKSLIDNIRFSDDYYQGEDLAFNCEYIEKCSNIKICDEILYNYIKRNDLSLSNVFVENYDKILFNKDKLLKKLLINNKQTYYNYMVKEYEVFLINLYKGKYSFNERNKLIKYNILNNIEIIKNSEVISSYSKLFKVICLSKNAYFINIIYYLLNLCKNILGEFYFNVRKKIYISDTNKIV